MNFENDWSFEFSFVFSKPVSRLGMSVGCCHVGCDGFMCVCAVGCFCICICLSLIIYFGLN